MNIEMKEMGIRIRQRRKELGLNQPDICRLCGISSGQISRLENGVGVPGVDMVVMLSKVLECDLKWLITGEENSGSEDASHDNEIYIDTFIVKDGKAVSVSQLFRQLDQDDQDEIIEIINLKLRRKEDKKHAKSSPSENQSDAI